SLAQHIALLLDHGGELFVGDARPLAELQMLLLDLAVQRAELVAVRARRHSQYIRIGRGRRYARAGRVGGGGRRLGRFERGPAAAEVERPLLALAHLAPPHLAVLVVARQELVEAEAARVVAHLLLSELEDVDLEVV